MLTPMNNPSQFAIAFLLSFLTSFLLTPFVIQLAKKLNLMDYPGRQHPAILHTTPLPRAGGLAIFAAFFIVSLALTHHDIFLYGILLGSLLNVASGTLDDRFSFSPWPRLGIQILSALIIVATGISTHHIITNPFGGHFNLALYNFQLDGLGTLTLPADLILMIFIVWLMNMVNWTKGVGQMPGVAVIAALVIGGVALKYQAGNPYQMQTALLSFILAGSVLAFVPFNFPPEKMLPGFGASTLIGFNLAVLSVLSGAKLAAVLLVLGVPMVDMLITVIRRVIHGKSPLNADRSHIYHLLLDLGLNKRQVTLLYWFVTTLLGLLALNLESRGKLFALVMISLLVVAIFITLVLVLRRIKPLTS